MTAPAFPHRHTRQDGMAMPAMTNPLRQACAVRLVDRRIGMTQRVNGSPLVVFTRNPSEAVAELLSGRNAQVW